MNDLKAQMLKIFKHHTTSDTAISRRQMEIELMTSDRMSRRMIEQARGQGIPIVSSSHKKGYWLSKEDYQHIHLAECRARIKAEKQKISAYFSEDPDQITIDEVI